MKEILFLPLKRFYISLAATVLISCNVKPLNMGVAKDLNTGLKATYKNIQPGEVSLIMHDETMTNSNIPLGESFVILNDKTTGLTQKDGKISVGCTLLITDEKGEVLMNAPDLFKDDDILKASPSTRLRCTVNTGKPMIKDEKYHVTVTFWDKYGDGKIVNEVTIKMIADRE